MDINRCYKDLAVEIIAQACEDFCSSLKAMNKADKKKDSIEWCKAFTINQECESYIRENLHILSINDLDTDRAIQNLRNVVRFRRKINYKLLE